MSWRDPIIATPQAVTGIGGSGGSLSAGVYAYRVVARRLVNQSTMGRSTASPEVVVDAPADGSAIRLTWDPVPGATEYRVYGRAGGAQSMYWRVTGTEFVDTGSAGTSESDTSTAGSGAITGWTWNFGDGGGSSAASASHAYSSAGTYTVVLTVVDGNGVSDSESTTVSISAPPPVNVAPVAAFDVACVDLTCAFTVRSTDSDGTITAWAWAFGAAGTDTIASPSFTFPAPGSYQVSLTVTDDGGATSALTKTVDVKTAIHNFFVATATSTGGNGAWRATVTAAVHRSDEQPVAGATVAVSWSGGWTKTASCVTNSVGQCTFKTAPINAQQTSVTLTVTSLSAPLSVYDPAANHSQVAGATGPSVTIRKP